MCSKFFIAFFSGFFVVLLWPGTVSGQSLPLPGEDFDAITENGIWTWYGEPKAVYYEGEHRRTYMGWNTNYGTQFVGYYDHDTKETETVELERHYAADDHCHPSVIMRPDGRLLAFNTGHDGREITEYISVNPEEISELTMQEVEVLDWCCYPNAVFLSAEGTQGRLYLFFRDADQEPHFRTSDDWGETWAPEKKFYYNDPHGYKPYCKFASNGVDEIHMTIERENRAGSAKPTYFMKYKEGVFYQADGTQIATMSQLPIVNTVLDTLMYPGFFSCGGTVWDVAIDENGHPVVVYDMYKEGYIHIYWYLRWTGTQWYRRALLNSGGTMGAQSQFAGGITLDHENPNIAYVSHQSVAAGTNVFDLSDTTMQYYKDSLKTSSYVITDSAFEITKWVTDDGGLTWDTMSITGGSVGKNCRPCVPRGHVEGMDVGLIWLNGTYTSMGGSGFEMAVRMFPTDATPVRSAPLSDKNPRSADLRITQSGIELNLVSPQNASLRIYSLSGRLVADLSAKIRKMSAGTAFMPMGDAVGANGTYIVKADIGGRCSAKTVFIAK